MVATHSELYRCTGLNKVDMLSMSTTLTIPMSTPTTTEITCSQPLWVLSVTVGPLSPTIHLTGRQEDQPLPSVDVPLARWMTALPTDPHGDWRALAELTEMTLTRPIAYQERARVYAQLWSVVPLEEDSVPAQPTSRPVYTPATIRIPCVRPVGPSPRAQLQAKVVEMARELEGLRGLAYKLQDLDLQRIMKQIEELPQSEPPTCTLTIHGPTAVGLCELADSQPGPDRQRLYRQVFGVEQQTLEGGQMLLMVGGHPHVVAESTMREVIQCLTYLHDPCPEEDC